MTPEDVPTRPESLYSQTPTLRDLLAVLFRQRRVVVSSFLVVLGLTAAYAWITPGYQAHMKILLRRGRVDPMVTAEPNASPGLARPEISEEELNSEVELLRDQELLTSVVKQSGLVEAPGEAGVSQEVDRKGVAEAVRRLAGRLRVDAIRKSNLIAVTYDASDPAQAARVLDLLATAYLAKHKAVRRSSEELPFFEQQTERSRAQLATAENQVLDFSQNQGVVAGAIERDLALQRMNELELGHQQAVVGIQETSRRAQELRSRLGSLPERSTTQIRTADNSQLLEVLKAKLLELELKKTELLTKFQGSYRLVQQVQTEIDQTRASIRAEELAPVRDETTEKDPHYEWTKGELDKAEVELTSLCARERAVRGELWLARKRAMELGEASLRQQNLLRGMKTAEETYLLYAKKSEEARIGDALDERGIVNAVLAEPPIAPVLPKRSPAVWIGLGVCAATIASLGLAFAMDYTDPAFRTPDEIAEYLHAPVLASLPKEAA
jgi:uncharacterized protein involved in exopolysaccharide biosynthesis